MNQYLSDDAYRAIYSKVPRLNVELLIINDNGVLLAKRAIEPWEGCWHLPGGRVLKGETLEQAIVRIGKLELGLEVEPVEIIGSLVYPSIKGQPKDFEWPVGVVFTTTVVGGVLEGWDLAPEVAWHRELPKMLIPEQKEFLTTKSLLQ